MSRGGFAVALLAAGVFLFPVGAFAADIDYATKAPPVVAPLAPPTCAGFTDFFVSNCILGAYGIQVYGTVDIGGGYQTHGAPFDKYFVTGASYFIQKMNRSAMWGAAPNGLSQSNIGIKGTEPIAPGWNFIFQLEAGFDPYSLQFANSPQSLFENRGLSVTQQSTNGDSSRGGQFDNSVGFAGISSTTFGTLTFGRQNALTLDGIAAYDPMGLSYAFSPIGFSGVSGGAGLTEEARANTALKYRYTYSDFRAGAIAQVGSYDLGNAAKGEYQGQVGGDIKHLGPGVLSLDGIYSYSQNAVALGLAGSNNLGTIGNAPGVNTPSSLVQATLANVSTWMALAKYVVGPLKVMGGYEYATFSAPSDVPIATAAPISIPAINGPSVGAGYPFTEVTTNAYSGIAGSGADKKLQIMWIGAKYSVTQNVEVTAAYYHYIQNDYLVATATTNCHGTYGNEGHSQCSGTMDAISALVDWKFAPKWDTYAGIMFSQMNGGLANGYLVRNNLDPTVGLRFRF